MISSFESKTIQGLIHQYIDQTWKLQKQKSIFIYIILDIVIVIIF